MKNLIVVFSIVLTFNAFATTTPTTAEQTVNQQAEAQISALKKQLEREAIDAFLRDSSEDLRVAVDLDNLSEPQRALFEEKLETTVSKAPSGWNELPFYYFLNQITATLNSAGLQPENVKMLHLSNGMTAIYYYVP